VYIGETFGGSVPLVVILWQIAERFGWSLEYVESLPMSRLAEYEQIEDGRAHSRNSLFRRGK
jgi:hypothetical protein